MLGTVPWQAVSKESEYNLAADLQELLRLTRLDTILDVRRGAVG